MSMVKSALFGSGAIPALERLVSFTEERQKLIAANIANVSTPYYKARDISLADFQESLAGAIEYRRSHPGTFRMSSAGSVSADSSGKATIRVLQRHARHAQLRHDENNVSIDEEMAANAKNGLLHRAAIELLRNRYGMLRTAISERV